MNDVGKNNKSLQMCRYVKIFQQNIGVKEKKDTASLF